MGILDAPVTPASIGAARATRVASAPSDVTSLGRYEPNRQGYNLQPAALRRLRAKLAQAKAGTGLCKIAVAGNSITAGQSVTFSTQSWPVVLRDFLATKGYTKTGTGVVFCSNSQAGTDTRWSFSSGWFNYVPSSIKTPTKAHNANGATATFTSDQTGTVASVYYANNSGTFTVSIDGGTAVAVTPTGSSSTTGVYTVTGLSNAVHTVVVTLTSTSYVYLIGAEVRGTTGVTVTGCGIGGATSTDFVTTNNAGGRKAVLAWAPDVVLIDLLTNDANTLTIIPAATSKANMQALITEYSATADVILVASIPGYDNTAAAPVAFTAYRQALYDLADSNNLPVLDLYDRWGTYASANGLGLMTDSLHPNAAGYADIAAAASALLAP